MAMASLLTSLSSKSVCAAPRTAQEAQGLEGYLKKKTFAGIWHKRYFFIRGGYLLHKHEKSSSSHDEKESLYFGRRGIVVKVCHGTKFEITFEEESEVQHYLADTAEEAAMWAKAIQLLAKNYLGHKNNGHMLEKSGWLLKKSGSLLQPMMQDRYFRIDNGNLRYYKKEHDKLENAQGSIDIVDATFVRPYDMTPDCTTFEIQESSTKRVYLLKASDHLEMSNWVAALDLVRVHAKVKQEDEEKARILADTPLAVQIYDSQGERRYLALLREAIDEIYHIADDSHGAMSLGSHIECGEALIAYLKQEVQSFKETSIRPVRYDIQTLLMEEINVSLSFKMFNAVQSDSPTLVDASLGDLHALILLLTSYQKDLAKIFLPQVNIRPNSRSCGLFDCLPAICERYINGGPGGSPPGAVSHLLAHCDRVWDTFLVNPAEVLQRHNDGTFFTFNPTDMWEAMNSHISLATSTRSEILHIMIANKIVGALNHTVLRIKDYVETVDISADTQLAEVQLEFFSALANDNASHIEEICAVVDHFDMDEIRDRINDMYDSLTVNLVACGQSCLRRLAIVIMSDVSQELEKVLTPEWLDQGRQVQVAIATISDYIGDLHTFLMPFWCGKFNYYIVEAVVVKYTSCVLAKKGPKRQKPPAPAAQAAAVEDGMKTLSKLMAWGRAKVERAKEVYKATKEEYLSPAEDPSVPSVELFVSIDAESLGRIAQDVNVLNGFFVKHSGAEDTMLFLSLIGEVQHFLVLPLDEVCHHALGRITEYPSSAAAIFDVARKCIEMRADIDAEDVEEHLDLLQPALQRANELALQYESEGVGEGQLGLLYLEVGCRGEREAGNKVARSVRNFAKIPLELFKNKVLQLLPGVREEKKASADEASRSARSSFDGELRDNSSYKELRVMDKNTERLIGDVIDLMQSEEDSLLLLAQEEECRCREEELERKWATDAVVGLESYLEKKSPTSNLWQKRWFKVATKASIDEETDKKIFEYSLMWFKKQGGAVIRAVNVDSIVGIIVVKSSRNLMFSRTTNTLLLESEVSDNNAVPVVQWKDEKTTGSLLDEEEEVEGRHLFDIAASPLDFAKNQLKQATKIKSHFHFNIIMQDDRVHVLKAGKVDKLIKWINTLAKVCQFSYDEETHYWSRDAYAAMLNAEVEGSAVAERIRQSVFVKPAMKTSMEQQRRSSKNRVVSTYLRARWQGKDSPAEDYEEDEEDEGGVEEDGGVEEEDDDAILDMEEQPAHPPVMSAADRRDTMRAKVREMTDSNSSFSSAAPPAPPMVRKDDFYDDEDIFEKSTDGGDGAKQRSASGDRIPMVAIGTGGLARASQGARNSDSDCAVAEQRGSMGAMPSCSVFADFIFRARNKQL